jgi:hypothetical protein
MLVTVPFLSFLPAGFHGQHFAIPAGDSSLLDIPCPDPNNNKDMDLPNQQALMEAFMAGNPFPKPIKNDVLRAKWKVHI